MTDKEGIKQSLSRRQFVQTWGVAVMGLLLTACRANSPLEEAAPTQAVAQDIPTTNTPIPPTATTGATDTPPPPETALPTEEPTLPPAEPPTLEPTPQCDDHDETPAQTAGPFYTPDTPERASLLEDGISGTKLVVLGRVLTTNCEPIAGAILDFWQADDNGEYDNIGYRLRGHQFTDENGNFQLETVMPGLYPGRTRHIHVKVQGPNTPLLTTQLYFPGEQSNQKDGIFLPELVMDVQDSADGKIGTFDFVFG